MTSYAGITSEWRHRITSTATTCLEREDCAGVEASFDVHAHRWYQPLLAAYDMTQMKVKHRIVDDCCNTGCLVCVAKLQQA
jgi:hypothetical protein